VTWGGVRAIAPEEASGNEFSPRAADDREFLRQMMAAGVGKCFDVLPLTTMATVCRRRSRDAHAGLNLAE